MYNYVMVNNNLRLKLYLKIYMIRVSIRVYVKKIFLLRFFRLYKFGKIFAIIFFTLCFVSFETYFHLIKHELKCEAASLTFTRINQCFAIFRKNEVDIYL